MNKQRTSAASEKWCCGRVAEFRDRERDRDGDGDGDGGSKRTKAEVVVDAEAVAVGEGEEAAAAEAASHKHKDSAKARRGFSVGVGAFPLSNIHTDDDAPGCQISGGGRHGLGEAQRCCSYPEAEESTDDESDWPRPVRRLADGHDHNVERVPAGEAAQRDAVRRPTAVR